MDGKFLKIHRVQGHFHTSRDIERKYGRHHGSLDRNALNAKLVADKVEISTTVTRRITTKTLPRVFRECVLALPKRGS